MRILSLVCILSVLACTPQDDKYSKSEFETLFEKSAGSQSAGYHEGIAWWKKLDSCFNEVNAIQYGMTDAGYPLHLVILGSERYDLESAGKSEKVVILINNAIHPGEPDGVDASMMLFRDILFDSDKKNLLDSVILVVIPYYNIGGALNRNSHSRANQNGPESYGFRGNAQNLDLNRDFVKCDSRNSLSFASLLNELDPDIYVETHVSNGADYQYTMTYISTQPDKLGYGMGKLLADELEPEMHALMNAKGDTMVPYVNVHGVPLDSSYETFYDQPRYSTGLAALNQTYGFITETHMLKAYESRVYSTYRFLLSSCEMAGMKASVIKKSRTKARKKIAGETQFVIDWTVDSTAFKRFRFKGYPFAYKTSEVSGLPRLYYRNDQPVYRSMYYYHRMLPSTLRSKPSAYILRKGFHQLEAVLQANGIVFTELKKDSILSVLSYKIVEYETATKPYEKHYYHFNTQFVMDTVRLLFKKGDMIISTGTAKDRFLVELFEPDAPDSYFNWNFFDAVLQQKEWFSPYVFEDKAAQYLKEDAALRMAFEHKKSEDSRFASDAFQQLYWIYQQSPHYESTHMVLPVYRME